MIFILRIHRTYYIIQVSIHLSELETTFRYLSRDKAKKSSFRSRAQKEDSGITNHEYERSSFTEASIIVSPIFILNYNVRMRYFTSCKGKRRVILLDLNPITNEGKECGKFKNPNRNVHQSTRLSDQTNSAFDESFYRLIKLRHLRVPFFMGRV